jgi:hypothetical protein
MPALGSESLRLMGLGRPCRRDGGGGPRKLVRANGRSNPMRVTREIVWLLAIKLVALTALYLLFFGPSHQMTTTPSTVAQHMMGR